MSDAKFNPKLEESVQRRCCPAVAFLSIFIPELYPQRVSAYANVLSRFPGSPQGADAGDITSTTYATGAQTLSRPCLKLFGFSGLKLVFGRPTAVVMSLSTSGGGFCCAEIWLLTWDILLVD